MKRLFLSAAVGCALRLMAYGDVVTLNYYFMFETWGDDCYADGTMLEEGECYALVWRHADLADQVEGLFDSNGVPVDPDKCEILAVFPAAVHGVWGGQIYAYAARSYVQVPRSHIESKAALGVYSLFVFDTRMWDGSKWVLGGKTSETTVAALRGYGLVTDLEDIKVQRTKEGENAFFLWDNFAFPDEADILKYDDGLSIGDKSVQLSQTSILPFSPQPPDEQVPVFSSVSIANGKVTLNVTNTLPSLQYGISWVTSVAEVFSKTNWVSDVKDGEKDAQTPLTWTIDLKGAPQGFFRILSVK